MGATPSTNPPDLDPVPTQQATVPPLESVNIEQKKVLPLGYKPNQTKPECLTDDSLDESSFFSQNSKEIDTATDEGDFEFTWKIENFNQLPPFWQASLKSPLFSHKADGQIRCYHQLELVKGDDVSELHCFLRGNSSEYQITSLEIRATSESFDSQGEIISFCSDSLIVLKSKRMDENKSLGKKYDFLQENSLILRCRLKVKFEKHEYDEYFVQLGRDMKCLYRSRNFSDLSLFTKDIEFPVHKFVLWARAPDFAKDLGLVSKDDTKTKVKVDNISCSVLRVLLLYLYSGQLESCSKDVVCSLFDICERYNLSDLKKIIQPQAKNFACTRMNVITTWIDWKIKNCAKMQVKNKYFVDVRFARFDITLILSKTSPLECTIKIYISCVQHSENWIYFRLLDGQGTFIGDGRFSGQTKCNGSAEKKEWSYSVLHKLIPCNLTMNLRYQLSVSDGCSTCNFPASFSLPAAGTRIHSLFHLSDQLTDLYRGTLQNKQTSVFPDVTFPGMNVHQDTLLLHRGMLAARSTVFHDMFTLDTREKRSGRVEIRDMERHVLHDLLRFIYCSKLISMTYTEVIKLYRAADGYDVPSLKTKCVSLLKSKLTVDNVSEIMDLGKEYTDSGLVEIAKIFWNLNPRIVPRKPDVRKNGPRWMDVTKR